MGANIAEQSRIAVENLGRVLSGAGMHFADVVKCTIYLTDPAHFEGFMSAAAPLVSSPRPPATLLYVKALAAPALLIEIEAIAAR